MLQQSAMSIQPERTRSTLRRKGFEFLISFAAFASIAVKGLPQLSTNVPTPLERGLEMQNLIVSPRWGSTSSHRLPTLPASLALALGWANLATRLWR